MKRKKEMVKKTAEQHSEETEALVAELRPIDDTLFEVIVQREGVFEEILDAVFEGKRPKVRKLSVSAQKSIRNISGRSVRIDAVGEDGKNIVYGLEVQRSDNDNHLKRARLIEAILTAYFSEKSAAFADVPDVCIVFMTEFDYLKTNSAVTKIRLLAEGVGDNAKTVEVNDGSELYFVSAKVDDGSKASRMMRLFLQSSFEDVEFPCLSKAVMDVKNDPEEVKKMCATIENYAENKVKEQKRKTFENLLNDGFSVERALKYSGAELEDVEDLIPEDLLTYA